MNVVGTTLNGANDCFGDAPNNKSNGWRQSFFRLERSCLLKFRVLGSSVSTPRTSAVTMLRLGHFLLDFCDSLPLGVRDAKQRRQRHHRTFEASLTFLEVFRCVCYLIDLPSFGKDKQRRRNLNRCNRTVTAKASQGFDKVLGLSTPFWVPDCAETSVKLRNYERENRTGSVHECGYEHP